MAKPICVGITFEIGKAGQDLFSEKAGIVLRAAVNLQQVPEAVIAGCEHEKPVRSDLPLYLGLICFVGNLVRVGPELRFGDPGFQLYIWGSLTSRLNQEAEIIDCQIVFNLKPARLFAPDKLREWGPVEAGNHFCAVFVQPVHHFRYSPALLEFGAVDVPVLVEKPEAKFSLAFIGEKLTVDLGEAQKPIVRVDGFKNALVAVHEPHGGRGLHATVPGEAVVLFGHAASIGGLASVVTRGVR